MKALFNGRCERCGDFKPRCANVVLVNVGTAMILCDGCRRVMRGKYRLAAKHK
jgi:hypothetical protein